MSTLPVEQRLKLSNAARKFDPGDIVVCIKRGPDFLKLGSVINIYSPLSSIYNKLTYSVRFKNGRRVNYPGCELEWPQSAQSKAATLLKELSLIL